MIIWGFYPFLATFCYSNFILGTPGNWLEDSIIHLNLTTYYCYTESTLAVLVWELPLILTRQGYSELTPPQKEIGRLRVPSYFIKRFL